MAACLANLAALRLGQGRTAEARVLEARAGAILASQDAAPAQGATAERDV